MANLITLARPYGRAAFDAAQSKKASDAWEQALEFGAHIAQLEEVQRLLGHPAVERAALADLFAPGAGQPDGYDAFLKILAENGRLRLLPQIAQIFSELKDASEQTVSVTVTTATQADESFRSNLQKSLEGRFNRKIDLSVEHDESLIGGARVKAGDMVIDGTVRGKLERMRSALAS